MNKYIEQIKSIALNNKYTKYYCSIIQKSLLRPQNRKELVRQYGYVESHHILPKCFNLGGVTDKENLVFLTAKEHFIVHLCATKMFISIFKNKMIFAFRQLKSSNEYQHRYINSRLYNKIKPIYKEYIRLYKEDKVKYIYTSETEKREELINSGWSFIMTNEYKKGRVGNMKGRKHSEETKNRMSLLSKGRPKELLKGRRKTNDSIRKQKESYQLFKINNPESYEKRMIEQGVRMKKLHRDGIFKENGMKGKKQSGDAKMKIGQKNKESWENSKKDGGNYKKRIQNLRAAQKIKWQNPELRKKLSIHNSKAYKKYNMLPLDFYNERLKILLYLGFLPTSIVKYRLLDMSKNYIKELIYKFGSEEDKIQFEANKKYMAGANKNYINFLEYQYARFFKDAIEKLPDYNSYDLEKDYQKFIVKKLKKL